MKRKERKTVKASYKRFDGKRWVTKKMSTVSPTAAEDTAKD